MSSVKSIPEGYQVVTPYLTIQGAAQAIEFYKNVFGATERMRLEGPNGSIGHAEIEIGGQAIMIADECPEMGNRNPLALGGSPVTIHLYVEDVDAVFNRALAAGAQALCSVDNRFYGDRSGGVVDPFGHVWHLATHVEDVSPEEINRRAANLFKEAQPVG